MGISRRIHRLGPSSIPMSLRVEPHGTLEANRTCNRSLCYPDNTPWESDEVASEVGQDLLRPNGISQWSRGPDWAPTITPKASHRNSDILHVTAW